jgi:hypothetical protein
MSDFLFTCGVSPEEPWQFIRMKNCWLKRSGQLYIIAFQLHSLIFYMSVRLYIL